MKRSNRENKDLPKGSSAFENLIIELTIDTHDRMSKLTDQIGIMAEKISDFAAHTTEAQNRLIKVTEDTNRIDDSLKEQGQRQVKYEDETSATLDQHTKQFSDIEIALTPLTSLYSNIKKTMWVIIGGVSIIALGAYFVGKQ